MRKAGKSEFFLSLIFISIFLWQAMAGAAHLISVCTCLDVKMPDISPVNIQDKFNPDAEAIHAVAVMDKVRPGTIIKGVWVSVDAIETPNYQIDAAEVQAVSADVRAHFALSKPNNGWPTGNYRLDIYVDNKFSTSVPFAILKSTSQSNSNAKTTKNDPASQLLGTWYCQLPMGTSVLVFQSTDKLSLDGQQAGYKVVKGALRVQDEYGTEDYPYKLADGTLTIRFPEGYELEFKKQSSGNGYADEASQDQYNDDYDDNGYSNQRNPASYGGNDLRQHFAGTWWNATRNTETLVILTADGRYYENYTAGYSGGSNDQYGNETMNWGAAGDQKASGQWTVQGNRERGQLTIIYPNGNQRAISYQVHVENGQYYWNEYYFNGELYGKK